MKRADPKNIVVIRPDEMGDVVLIIPMISTIKKNWPNARVTVLLQPYTVDVLNGHPCVDDIITMPKGTFVTQLNWFRSFRFDVAIMPYLEPRYAFLALLSRIPVRVGDRNKIGMRLFLNRAIPLHLRNIVTHEVEHNINLLKALDPDIQVDPSLTTVPSDDAYGQVDTLLAESGLNDAPIIGVHPSTGRGNRAWLPGQYAELIDLIQTKTGYKVYLTGATPSDRLLNTKILQNCKTDPVDLAGKTSIDDLKVLFERSKAVIGADTGPTHLAASVSTPVVCISPSKFVKSTRWGPWDTANAIVSNAAACPLVCNPYKCRETECLDAITPQDVFEKMVRLITVSEPEGSEQIRRSKKAWFTASNRVLILLDHDSSPDTVQRTIDAAKAENLALKIGCFSRESHRFWSKKLNCPVDFLGRFPRLVNWVAYVRRHDITVVDFHTEKNQWVWKTVVRQIAAMWQSCPFIKVPNRPRPPGESLVSTYMTAFISYYSAN